MKLKKINRIRQFGIFDNFSWHSNTLDFSFFNVLYGWNYSGKTTLSRIFRSFELGQLHLDYKDASFELEDYDGNKYQTSYFPNKLPIKVFNSDFINTNLKWNEGIEPILILGKENIDLQNDLDQHRRTLKTLQSEIASLNDEKRQKENAISSALTARARDLKYELSIPVFHKTHFEPFVYSAFQSGNNTLLTPEEVSALRTTLLSNDKKAAINSISLSLQPVDTICGDVNTLLQTSITSKIIDRLRNNITLSEWVKKGKELHKEKDTCEFCGNKLPKDLLENLSDHFSKDYEQFINSLQEKIKELERLKISITLPDSANFYLELQDNYVAKKSALEVEIEVFNKEISTLNRALESKKLRAFDILAEVKINSNYDKIEQLIYELNAIIKTHNTKTNQFEKQKDVAYESLMSNFALEFVINQSYGEKLKEIDDIGKKIPFKQLEFSQTEKSIQELELTLSETVKGATTINDYLRRYFGKDDIQIAVTNNNKFQILRQSRIAKNLSEGEKTAIAFAYFITCLRDKHITFSDLIVYIDDPISSLDSNHLFNTYSFIKDTFYEFEPKGNPKHKCKCAQLFISTHNYEFFNLIKDWFDKLKNTFASRYLILRTTNSSTDEASISALDNHLTKFKSEYSYLFSIIYKFKNNPSASFDQLYNLPNIIRRFIEAFTAFKYLSTINIEEKIDLLIPNTVDCERVRKFAHYHTHGLSTTKMEQFADLSECINVIEILTKAIENLDPIHYQSLVAENTLETSTNEVV